jgi:F-type H+-transporting ATPase subunit delta
VFHGDHWAAAFISVLGENAEAGLACLKAMTPPVQAVKGALFGRFAAKQLEKILREAADSGANSGAGRPDIGAEYAIRFISLLVEKNFFRHIDLILEKIEKRLDEQKGILDVTAESAAPMDSAFEENLRQMIQERTGAAGIKMKTRLAPELLGGYRLRIGGLCVDASLKRQLEKMTADLAAPFAAVAGA